MYIYIYIYIYVCVCVCVCVCVIWQLLNIVHLCEYWIGPLCKSERLKTMWHLHIRLESFLYYLNNAVSRLTMNIHYYLPKAYRASDIMPLHYLITTNPLGSTMYFHWIVHWLGIDRPQWRIHLATSFAMYGYLLAIFSD